MVKPYENDPIWVNPKANCAAPSLKQRNFYYVTASTEEQATKDSKLIILIYMRKLPQNLLHIKSAELEI